MQPCVAHLHRARMRAQEKRQALRVLQIDVEGVLHRARRMVLGIVERREVEPVGLDLRPVGDVEAERAPDRLDALPGAHDRMDAASSATAAWPCTARSASTLRSMSICARFSPAMKLE